MRATVIVGRSGRGAEFLAASFAASAVPHLTVLFVFSLLERPATDGQPVTLSVVLAAVEAEFGSHPRRPERARLLPERKQQGPHAEPVRDPERVPEATRIESAPLSEEPPPSSAAPAFAAGPVEPSAASSQTAAPPSHLGETERVAPPEFRAAYLQNPVPRYPASARRGGEQRTVFLRVLVTAEGQVARIDVDRPSGSKVLDRVAAEAVKAWRFRPARRGAQPIEAWVVVPIVFKLQDES